MQQPMPNPEDITDPTTAMNMALVLMAKAFKLNYSTPTNNNQRISSNPRNRQIAQPGMNMGQDRQMRMVGANGGNQFRQYAGQNVGYQNGYNAVQNVGNQVVQDAVQNQGVQNVGNQNGQIVVPGITNQNPNGNGNVVAARAEGNATGNNGNQIRCYNCRGLGHLARELDRQTKEKGSDIDELRKSSKLHFVGNLSKHRQRVTQTDNAPRSKSVEQEGGTVDQHPTTVEETHAYFENIIIINVALETLELEIERLLRAVVSQDIMSIVQNPSVVDSSNLQTELDRTKERLENCIIKKENEYAKLWNDWYKKCEECKYDKIRYDKAILSDMHKRFERMQASWETKKELEFQVRNYEKEIAHLKTTYKNLFDSISVTRAQTKTIIDSLQNKLHDTIYENAKLRAQLFDKVSEQVDTTKGTSTNTKFANQSAGEEIHLCNLVKENLVVRQPNAFQSEHTTSSKNRVPQKVDETNDLSKPVTSNSVPTPQESKIVKHDNVIAPGMFRINPFKPSREEKYVPNKVRASVRTNPITVSQPHVVTKKDVNSDSNGLSSTGVDNTAKTRRPQPRSNTKNDRVPLRLRVVATRNKEFELDIRNDKSEVICAMCKQCLITANHDVCMLNYVNDMNSRGKKQKPKVIKPKKVGSNERLASPKPSKPRFCLRWSPTGRFFDIKGKIIASSESESQSDCSNGDNACTSNPSEPTIKRFPNSTSFLGRLSKFVYGTVRFGNDHVAAILGYSDLQRGNILIIRVYFVKGLGHNLFSVGQFCDSDLQVAFRMEPRGFVRNLDGVDLLKGNRTTNLYTINIHEMASASSIYLMALEPSSTSRWDKAKVLLKTIGDLDVLTKDIEVGKHEELLSGMTNDKRMAVMDTLFVMCDSIEADNSPNDSIVQSVDIQDKPSSYVGASEGSKPEPSKLKANFRSLFLENLFEGANFSIPRKVVETVSTRFVNTLNGYFISKRIAFPVVEYYVRNNWGKYGLTRIMMNSKGFFFFQFETSKGLEDVLENRPWMIRNSPIILKKWTMNSRLCKEELTRIPPIMFDSYTSSMCIESWGRSSFARCLIEINANDVLKESLTMGVPLINELVFTIEIVSIEYEWKPPCCDLCKIFGHVLDHFPKKVSVPSTVVTPIVVTLNVEKTHDGFQTVGKKKKGKSKSTNGG
ncbi:integrase, catalytic region, zinc finger, CCHC-type containing protein [Tanacetum coccineum]